MSQPAKPSLGRKVLKVAGWIVGCLFGLVLIFSIIFFIFLEPITGRILKDQVREETDGLYTLAFEDLQISLLTATVTLQQLRFSPDTAVHQQQRQRNTAPGSLFKLETPKLQVSKLNLRDLLFRDRITIGTISAEQPAITLLADESVERSIEAEKEDALPGFLDNLQIGKIDIQDASFRYLTFSGQSTPTHELSQVFLQIQDFSITPRDQVERSNRFEADEVQLRVRDYTYQAKDSVYQLQVSLLTYASKQASLLAEGVELLADHQRNAALPSNEAKPTLYNIKVPALRLTGLELLEAYGTKRLVLKEVLLEKPEATILLTDHDATAASPPDVEEFYKQLSVYLTAIELEKLRLIDGNIKISEKAEELHTVHELAGTEIALQNIYIDSATLFSPKNNLPAEALHFSAGGYTYQHPLSPHVIQTGNITLSTRDNNLQVTGIQVRGSQEKNNRLKQSSNALPLVYTINAAGLHVSNMNLKQALQTGTLRIGTVDILCPAIEVARDKSLNKKSTEVLLQEAYAAVSDVISSLEVKSINIHDASFRHRAGTGQMRRIQELQHISLQVSGLEIDSAYLYSPAAQGLPLEEAVLTAHNYVFRTPDRRYTFTLERIHYSTRTQLLAAQTVALASNQAVHNRLKATHNASSNRYNVAATHLSVTGLDLIKAIDTGELFVDQVMLRQPDIVMFKDHAIPAPPQDQEEKWKDIYTIVNPIRINRLRMEDGTFTYREKRADVVRTQQLNHASATVLDLNLGSARLGVLEDALPMREMTLTAAGYTYRSPDGIYTIELDSLLYSSLQQELTARRIDVVSDKETNARLKRDNRKQANRTLFDVSAESFRIRGIDLIKAYETGRFAMAEIVLDAPEVAILQDRNVPSRSEDGQKGKSSTNDSETLKGIAEVVETFQVGQLRIQDGNVRFNILQDTILTSQQVAHVSVAIDQLRTVSLKSTNSLEMFQADDIGVLVRDYTYQLPDSLHSLQVREIRSSLQEQSLYIEDLRLLPLYGQDEFMSRLHYEEDRFDVHVPQVLLRNVNLEALFDNQRLIVGKALAKNPVVDIYRDKRLPENPERKPPTLQEMLRQTEDHIAIDTIAVESGKLTYREVAPNGLEPGILLFENTNLNAFNVTNAPARLIQDSIAEVHAAGLLMGESEISVRFLFHLAHPEDMYTYEGTLQPMDFTALNPLFMNLIFVSIEGGQIEKASFTVESTEHLATGHMRLYYNDFKIQLIDRENPENPRFLRKAGSWALNKLVIKTHNPAGRRDLREGAIEVERDYTKSVFNHMAKAMIDGITSSLMVPFVDRIADKLIEF